MYTWYFAFDKSRDLKLGNRTSFFKTCDTSKEHSRGLSEGEKYVALYTDDGLRFFCHITETNAEKWEIPWDGIAEKWLENGYELFSIPVIINERHTIGLN